MLNHRYFLTGTDTDAGKTLVSQLLLYRAKVQQLQGFGLKPVAAGCELIDGQLSNSDARLLRHASSVQHAYLVHNPIALEAAIAPHIAARQVAQELSVERLLQACQPALTLATDVTLVEGAGGWLVPLNQQQTLADFAIALKAPVILVVGMKLGCLNHAMLSANSIINSGLPLAGWVANQIDPDMLSAEENLADLTAWFHDQQIPHLGTVPNLIDTTSEQLCQSTDYIRWPWECGSDHFA